MTTSGTITVCHKNYCRASIQSRLCTLANFCQPLLPYFVISACAWCTDFTFMPTALATASSCSASILPSWFESTALNACSKSTLHHTHVHRQQINLYMKQLSWPVDLFLLLQNAVVLAVAVAATTAVITFSYYAYFLCNITQ